MKDARTAFAQAFASHMSSLTDDEQKALTTDSKIDPNLTTERTRTALLQGLNAYESPLQMARRKINAQAKQTTERFSDNINDPRSYLIELMSSGRLPSELTLAFRDGKSFSDEDLRSLIDDLEILNNDSDQKY